MLSCTGVRHAHRSLHIASTDLYLLALNKCPLLLHCLPPTSQSRAVGELQRTRRPNGRIKTILATAIVTCNHRLRQAGQWIVDRPLKSVSEPGQGFLIIKLRSLEGAKLVLIYAWHKCQSTLRLRNMITSPTSGIGSHSLRSFMKQLTFAPLLGICK